MRKALQKTNHCLDCGITILSISKRCNSCSSIHKWKDEDTRQKTISSLKALRPKKINYCVDCGIECNGTRCRKCYVLANRQPMSDETKSRIGIRANERYAIPGFYSKWRIGIDKRNENWRLVKPNGWRSGENNSNWRGGRVLEEKRIRNSEEYALWRKLVFGRDNYTCQKCGRHGGYLHAHHIEEFSKNPKLRLDVNNGITLCRKCHGKIHGKNWDD